MASDNEVSCCEGDPNFPVICAFIEKFGVVCGLTNIDFAELQDMLENTQEVSPGLIDIHLKLMRKIKKSVTMDKWEKTLIKISQLVCTQDSWEIERFGYKNAKLSSKIRILKELLEMQFDYFTRFKTEVNKMSANELRSQPLGRDKLGNTYWFLSDDNYQIKVYKEDADDGTLRIVAKDKDSLLALIRELNDDETKPHVKPIRNAENIDNSDEKPLMDTGQSDQKLSPKTDIDSSEQDTNSTLVLKESIEDAKNEAQNISEISRSSVTSEKKVDSLKVSKLSEPKITLKIRPLADLQKTNITDSESSTDSDEFILKRAKIDKIRIKNISSGNAEISEVIEEPPVIVTGEGSGVENDCGNPEFFETDEDTENDSFHYNDTMRTMNFIKDDHDLTNAAEVHEISHVSDVSSEATDDTNYTPIVGEEIVESVFYIYGHGSGAENLTGNDSKTEETDRKANQGGSVLSENRTLKTSDNSVSRSDITEGELTDNTDLEQEVPTSPVKNPFKLGTILDTKTDKSFPPKFPVKKSRWDVENSEIESTGNMDMPIEGNELPGMNAEIATGNVKNLVEKFEELASPDDKEVAHTTDSTSTNNTFFFGPGSSPFKYTSAVKDIKENSSETRTENHETNDVDSNSHPMNENDIEDEDPNVNSGSHDEDINCPNDAEGVDAQISSSGFTADNSDVPNTHELMKKDQSTRENARVNHEIDIPENKEDSSLDIADVQSSTNLEYNLPEVSETEGTASENPSQISDDLLDRIDEIKVSSTSDSTEITPTDSCNIAENIVSNSEVDQTVDDSDVNNPEETATAMEVGDDSDINNIKSIENDGSHGMDDDTKEDQDSENQMSEPCEQLEIKEVDIEKHSDDHIGIEGTDESSNPIEGQITTTQSDNDSSQMEADMEMNAVHSTNENEECSDSVDNELTAAPLANTDFSLGMFKDEDSFIPKEAPVTDIYSTVDSVCNDNMLSDINSDAVPVEDVLGENLSSEGLSTDVNIATGDEPSNVIDFDDLPTSNILEDDAPIDITPMEESLSDKDMNTDTKDDSSNIDEGTKPEATDSLNIGDILDDEPLEESKTISQDEKSGDVSLDAMLSGDIISKEESVLDNPLISEEVDNSKNLPEESNLDELADDLGTSQIMNNLLPDNEAAAAVSDLEGPLDDFPEAVSKDVTSSGENSLDKVIPNESIETRDDESNENVPDEQTVNQDMTLASELTSSDGSKDINSDDVDDVNIPTDTPPVDMFDVDKTGDDISGETVERKMSPIDTEIDDASDPYSLINNPPDVNNPADDHTEIMDTGVTSEETKAEDESVTQPEGMETDSSEPIDANNEAEECTMKSPDNDASKESNIEDVPSVQDQHLIEDVSTSGDEPPSEVVSSSGGDFLEGNALTAEDTLQEEEERFAETKPAEEESTVEEKLSTQDIALGENETDVSSNFGEKITSVGNRHIDDVDESRANMDEKEAALKDNQQEDKAISDEDICDSSPETTEFKSNEVSDPNEKTESKISEKNIDHFDDVEKISEASESNNIDISKLPHEGELTEIGRVRETDEAEVEEAGEPELVEDQVSKECPKSKSASTEMEAIQKDQIDDSKCSQENEVISDPLKAGEENNSSKDFQGDQIEDTVNDSKANEVDDSMTDLKDVKDKSATDSRQSKTDESVTDFKDGKDETDESVMDSKENEIKETVEDAKECEIDKLEELGKAKLEEAIPEKTGDDERQESENISETSEHQTDVRAADKENSNNKESESEKSKETSQVKTVGEAENTRRSTRRSGKDFKAEVSTEKPKRASLKGKNMKATMSVETSLKSGDTSSGEVSQPKAKKRNKQEADDFQPVVVVERAEMENKDTMEAKISTRRSGRFSKENTSAEPKSKTTRKSSDNVNNEVSAVKNKKAAKQLVKEIAIENSTDSDSGKRKSEIRKRGRSQEIVETKSDQSTEVSDRPLRGGRRSNVTTVKAKEEQKIEQLTNNKKAKVVEEVSAPEKRKRGRPRNSSPLSESVSKQKTTPTGKKSKTTLTTSTSTSSLRNTSGRGVKGLRGSSSGSTPVASPQVVSVECDTMMDSCSDVAEIQEKDPLAVTESDPESSKASLKDSSNSRGRRGLRKRGLDSPEHIPDLDEAIGKKPKLKGKRSTDVQLRRSIEEKKRAQTISSSEEDLIVLSDSNSAHENKKKSPAKKGRKSKTPQKKSANIDSLNSETPQPSKKKKVIETRNSKSKKR